MDSLETAVIETIECMKVPRNIAEGIVRTAAFTQHSEVQDRNLTLLRGLRQHIRSLKHLERRKNMVIFADGFLFQELTYAIVLLLQWAEAAVHGGCHEPG
jgi:hypothetical protein